MKNKKAVFTIARNESYFLPKWIKHYKKFFDDSDIYILDHNSTDDSTKNLNVNVINITYNYAFDHHFLKNTVRNFQKNLLEKYEVVVFSEADELIYSIDKPLNEKIDEFVDDAESKYITTIGYEIIHDMESEKLLSLDDSIIENRDFWYRNPVSFEKTLISKIPINWSIGFHEIYTNEISTNLGVKNFINKKTNTKYLVYLCHLHRIDIELMVLRHKERESWVQFNDGHGNHNRTADRDVLIGMINQYKELGYPLEKIPQEHKLALHGI